MKAKKFTLSSYLKEETERLETADRLRRERDERLRPLREKWAREALEKAEALRMKRVS